MKMNNKAIYKRFVLLLLALLTVGSAGAVTVSNGGVNYSLTAQALAEMTEDIVLTMGYLQCHCHLYQDAGWRGWFYEVSPDAPWSHSFPHWSHHCHARFLRLQRSIVRFSFWLMRIFNSIFQLSVNIKFNQTIF